MFSALDFSSFQLRLEQASYATLSEKKLDYLKLEISNICNVVERHCPQTMKIVHRHASGCFDWLISVQQRDNPSKEAISILSGK